MRIIFFAKLAEILVNGTVHPNAFVDELGIFTVDAFI